MTKSVITALAVAVAGLVSTSPRAEAGLELSLGLVRIYVSDHAACGCPIYTKRTCRGYDRYRRPIFSYQRQPFHCTCKGRPKPSKYYKDHEKAHKKYLKERAKHHKKACKGKKR